MLVLAVVGAGPKGIAIAAKARALAAAGLDAPRVVLVEPGAVAGNWGGRQGYTSGLLPLGTPAEKDIGFPYASSWGPDSAAVTAAMADYSWQRHLIEQGAYADWVDRGRLRPTHRQWSWYLREVAGKAGAEIIAARVTSLEAAGGRWRLTVQPRAAGGAADSAELRAAGGAADSAELRAAGGAEDGAEPRDEVWADGVVVTGAGPPIRVARQPEGHPRVLDGRSYWLAQGYGHLARNVCVIGSGETAASVVISLVSKLPKRSTIDVVTSRGVLYSRGESYAENRLYSDPVDWPGLAESHRREFLERTDRGVFSQQAETTLNGSRGFRALAGRAVADPGRPTAGRGGHRVRHRTGTGRLRPGCRGHRLPGPLVRGTARRPGTRPAGQRAGRSRARAADRTDLSVAGLSPPLHLPAVAGLAQGPGFPNLSCLGLLSDRILGRYVTAAERRERV